MSLLFASLPNLSLTPEPGATPGTWIAYLLLWGGIALGCAGMMGWLWMRLRRKRQAGEPLWKKPEPLSVSWKNLASRWKQAMAEKKALALAPPARNAMAGRPGAPNHGM